MASHALEETVRLPEELTAGRFDRKGEPDVGGRVFIGMGSGICHIWAKFDRELAGGETAAMTFENVPGDYINTGNFSEWSVGPPGDSIHALVRKPLASMPGTKFPEPITRIGPDTRPMQIESGTWDVEVDVYERGPDEEPTKVRGVERNHLMRNVVGDEWIVSLYSAPFHGSTFEHHGIWGYDPNTGRYHGSWVKTVQSNLSVFEGEYDPVRHLLTFTGTTRNCFGERGPEGKVIPVTEQRIIRYVDRNTKTMEVWQTEPNRPEEWVRRDNLVAHRRSDEDQATEVNVPRLSAARMELVALQHGWRTARVVGRNHYDEARPVAAGLVMLGPGWNAVYGDSLRLADSHKN